MPHATHLDSPPIHTAGRWLVAAMGTLIQLGLGTVYAWSFFQKPLVTTFGWSNSAVSLTFSLAICFLGLAAAWGGMNLPRFGPRKLAVTGGLLYATGWLLGALALALKSLTLLYLGFGVIGGIGLGLSYVTPVATAAKWFPDKKGLVTGMVVMGFGLGASLMSKIIAPPLMACAHGNLVHVFAYSGLILGALIVPAACVLRNPPDLPATTSTPTLSGESTSGLFTAQFALIWSIFFCNIAAGIMFIGFQSPLLQDILKRSAPTMTTDSLAAAGATLIAVSSLFNGVGRLLWGGLSDRIGRVQTFRLILISQVLVFLALLTVQNPWIFAAMVCYILLCYGGGFGAMPSFILDTFGQHRMPVVYGSILTAWSAAGIIGPLIAALIKDHYPADPATAARYTFATAAAILLTGTILCFRLSKKPADRA